jgi:SAM-dependent methyltransferase
LSIGSQLRLLQWSFRKLRLGIKPGALVLDVGSGGNPHPRADVLLEKYVHGQHRHGVGVVADRPVVFADACQMPFKDKAFDFVIAFHVLEHMRDPASFLRELSRVSKAGYIETPNVMFERLVPYDVHLLEIADIDGRLHIQKKATVATDTFVGGLQLQRRDPGWTKLLYGTPDLFHVQYHWKNSIDFEIVNPDENCDWFREEQPSELPDVLEQAQGTNWRSRGLRLLRRLHASRRSPVRLQDILVCPLCKNGLLAHGDELECVACSVSYPARPWPNFATVQDERRGQAEQQRDERATVHVDGPRPS